MSKRRKVMNVLCFGTLFRKPEVALIGSGLIVAPMKGLPKALELVLRAKRIPAVGVS